MAVKVIDKCPYVVPCFYIVPWAASSHFFSLSCWGGGMGQWLGWAGQPTTCEWSYKISEEKAGPLFEVINIYQIRDLKQNPEAWLLENYLFYWKWVFLLNFNILAFTETVWDAVIFFIATHVVLFWIWAQVLVTHKVLAIAEQHVYSIKVSSSSHSALPPSPKQVGWGWTKAWDGT